MFAILHGKIQWFKNTVRKSNLLRVGTSVHFRNCLEVVGPIFVSAILMQSPEADQPIVDFVRN